MQYESLLSWLFGELDISANGSEAHADELLAFCRRLDHWSGKLDQTVESITCGIELHHDGSGRIDYGILINSSQHPICHVSNLPSWWPSLIEKCSADNSFIPHHYWLEFDSLAHQSPVLAGIFQAVQPPSFHHLNGQREKLTSQLLDHLGKLDFSCEVLNASQCLQLCLAQLGIPEQIGLMVGRGDLIKLVLNISEFSSETLLAFCDSCQQQGLLVSWPMLTNRSWLASVQSSGLIPMMRLSLDINLNEDRFLPRIGIEIGNTITQKGNSSPQLHDLCRQVIGIDMESLMQFERLQQQLPTGYKRIPGRRLAALNNRADHQTHLRVASLSHVKLVLSPEQRPVLKSYIEAQHINLPGLTA